MEWLCSNNPSKKCSCRDVCNNIVKCEYCWNQAKIHYRLTPLCDNIECFKKLNNEYEMNL